MRHEVAGTGENLDPGTQAVPGWVVPGPLRSSGGRPPMPRRRTLRFAALLLLWFVVFAGAPGAAIWASSPYLRLGGPKLYSSHITCRTAAAALGENPARCARRPFRNRVRPIAGAMREERRRVAMFGATVAGAAFVATVFLCLAAGLRAWWALLAFVSPANLALWVWGLWRVSAHPVRYWEARAPARG